jgi:DNA-binding SARP family transcriptional activator
MNAPRPDGLRLVLLGGFELRRGARVVLDRTWPRGRAKALLKLVALDGPVHVDVAEFRALAHAALDGGDPAALDAAIVLFPGDLLPEDLYEEWATGPRRELQQLRRAGSTFAALGQPYDEARCMAATATVAGGTEGAELARCAKRTYRELGVAEA